MSIDWRNVFQGTKRGLKVMGLVLTSWLAYINLR